MNRFARNVVYGFRFACTLLAIPIVAFGWMLFGFDVFETCRAARGAWPLLMRDLERSRNG